MSEAIATKFTRTAWTVGLVVSSLANVAMGQVDVVVFDEDDPVGAGYYDSSVAFVTAPSLLTTFPSPNGGKLTILTDHHFTGNHSGLVEWRSVAGGSWTFFIALPGFQTRDLSGYSNIVCFVNGPAAIPASSLPKIGLESSTNQKTPTPNLGSYLPSGMDGDTNTWQRIVVPLTAFQPFGTFSLAQFKDVFFTQGVADGVPRTLWLDNLRATDAHVPATPGPVVTRAGDRSTVLHWPRNPESDIVGYAIHRSTNSNGPFALVGPTFTVLPSFADLSVSNGQTYYYIVRGVNGAWTESADSVVASAAPEAFADDSEFLEYVSQTAFDYFWFEANPTNGLVRDRSQPNSAVSIAAVGFGLTGIGIAIDRGWITRDEGRQRLLTTLRTFRDGPQGTNLTGMIGNKGWYYHFLHLNTGTRAGDSELSSIDSALLLAGVLYARAFFDLNQTEENEIRSAADVIFNRVDWAWMANGQNSLTLGWKPESGFLPWRWIGYNEAMVLYILGLGTATNPLAPAHWSSWVSGYSWRTNYGYAYVEFPPLMGHQYSHCWIDFRHIADGYMNNRAISYFENSRRAVLAQQAYCIANPGGWVGYSSNVWGLTPCDGPGFGPYAGYTARGAPPAQNDDGTLAPTAIGSSLPFAPEACLPTLRYFYDQFRSNIWTGYGFRDAFNLTANWWGPDVIGLDQGSMLVMIENYRTQDVWRRCAQIPEFQRGLAAAGFTNLNFVAPFIQSTLPAGDITLTWTSALDRSYQVEYSSNLRDWFRSPTGFRTATNATVTWVDTGPPATDSTPAAATNRFYRVFRYGLP